MGSEGNIVTNPTNRLANTGRVGRVSLWFNLSRFYASIVAVKINGHGTGDQDICLLTRAERRIICGVGLGYLAL